MWRSWWWGSERWFALTRLRVAQPPSPASQEKDSVFATKVTRGDFPLLRSGRGWLSYAKLGEGKTPRADTTLIRSIETHAFPKLFRVSPVPIPA